MSRPSRRIKTLSPASISCGGRARRVRPRVDREEIIKMTALGLLLTLVVVATIVYIAGLACLARHDVRQAESPPREIVSRDLTDQRS